MLTRVDLRASASALHRALKDSDLVAQGEISNWSAARLRNEAASAAMSAVNRCPNGNRTMSDKLQFINLIGICGEHSERRKRNRDSRIDPDRRHVAVLSRLLHSVG